MKQIKKMNTSQFIFFFLLLIVGSHAENQILELNTNNKEVLKVSATLNTVLDVRVKGNPTTGFNWFVENANELNDAKVLTPLNLNDKNASKDYVTNTNTNGAFGVGGFYSFQFLPSNEGNALIKLSYKRPWLKSSGQTYTLDVTVEKQLEDD